MEITQKEEQGLRLRKLIDVLDINQKEFSSQIGVTQGYLSRVLSGHKSISWKMTIGISKAFPMVNQNWITSGKGEMILPSGEEKLQVVEEVGIKYEADPLSSLRSLLDDHGRRLAALEAEVERLGNELEK